MVRNRSGERRLDVVEAVVQTHDDVADILLQRFECLLKPRAVRDHVALGPVAENHLLGGS